jgi:5-methylcytosine-specific restriction protein A
MSQLHHRARWHRLAKAQLDRQPLCAMCLEEGRTTPATVADHVVPHHGDPMLFWRGKLQSLCVPHHNAAKRRAEIRGYDTRIGEDGWPTDHNHPVYQRSNRWDAE